MRQAAIIGLSFGLFTIAGTQSKPGLTPKDLSRLESVGDVQLSPDGTRVAYSVTHSERPGRPYSDVWIRQLTTDKADRVENGSAIRWSPDGKWIAYFGRNEEGTGLIVADAAGEDSRLMAPRSDTNHPLPSSGKPIAWSPDARFIAFVSATPGPETDDASGDPVVITRYLYKPTAAEGLTRFNDNRRLHIFVADVASRQVRQLTDGPHYEHSIDWSPKGDEILFVSNREARPDRVFNYDIFAVRVKDGATRRLTNTRSAEYFPVWSPDGARIAFSGTKRDLTSSETTMEDTHVWVMNKDGSRPQELGVGLDHRQGAPQWSSDGRHVYFTMQERGNVRLMRLPATGGPPEPIVSDRGSVGSWSVAKDKRAYAFMRPESPADLFIGGVGRSEDRSVQVTTLNREMLDGRALADVEAFTFKSFDGTEIEAFLTKPLGVGAAAATKHPLIVLIHGGPHAQQGPGFNAKAQVYAGIGWASLMVNYRGSTGYGQKLADAIFKDQNGGEAKDVLAGVEAALERYPWLDRARMGIEGGSYGGQLTNWIITQTNQFKAAIPSAGIANLVSFNYMAYYHDYLAVEYGAYPHEQNIVELLWERSPIRLAKNVRTPTLLLHGENDNDVPIAEAEQFYIALHDVGVETVLVRYPREGHGLRETRHVVDALERSIAWYLKNFARTAAAQQ